MRERASWLSDERALQTIFSERQKGRGTTWRQMAWNRVFPERTWKLERADDHPKRPRVTIPKNKLAPSLNSEDRKKKGTDLSEDDDDA
jgi:hypothetical protein